MALARARRSESGFNYWPGFVDALSTLVLSIVFLLSVFLVVQFFLSQEVTGKDKALEQLNAKIAQLNDLLSLEKLGKLALDDQIGQLRAQLQCQRKAGKATPHDQHICLGRVHDGGLGVMRRSRASSAPRM